MKKIVIEALYGEYSNLYGDRGNLLYVQEKLRRAGVDHELIRTHLFDRPAFADRAVDLRRAKLRTMALVIGSEGRGVRTEVLSRADQELIIPMNPHCESLNAAVAAAIVMWQMKTEE